ncbi:TIGR01777 family oxidoreductase [Microbacterium paraoxydans]|uniref:TIGR01777 family oxidoreductase n=1 Tax=Microbacterium paraoxydans TaxID=199592 RepID=A0ABS5IP87_9MICO|nr:TIGR01777 family oxidoreductase [Microbacterium paraoxydans]MBS0024772.1 TIGR01777 family oxidoreductase [Microbacterium paraoxydans]
MARRIVISGASGLIGSALAESLRRDGVQVETLVRRPPREDGEHQWMPGVSSLNHDVLDGADAVVALGGASVGRLPWTPSYRRELVESRLDATRTLTTALRALGTDAPALVSASAVGYYGTAPGEILTEDSAPGSTFLANLCVRWEAEARRVEDLTSVALLRTAPVIHRRGVLRPLLLLTRLGVAGPLGSGTQTWPWISLDDEVRAIRHVVDRRLTGPVNLTGPTPATMNDIGRALAARMHRPYWLRAPGWALRAALGDAADSLLLPDADVRPEALNRSAFSFRHATAADAVAAAV